MITVKIKKMKNETYCQGVGSRTHIVTFNGKNYVAFILNIKNKNDFENTFGLSNAYKYNGQKQVLCVETFNNKDFEKIAFHRRTLDNGVIFYIDVRMINIEK